jgi:Cys-tRNA(Pro) deacylase
VAAFLESHGLHEEIVHFDRSTKTAALAAEAVGCELGQIVKSLVFVVDDEPILVLVAGDRRGDPAAISQAAGGSSARIAKADEVRDATGFVIGGVSPFDLPADLPVLLDESLGRFEVVYTAAGTPSSVVPIAVDDLAEMTGGRTATVAD